MCGRFVLKTPAPQVAQLFHADLLESFQPHYNIPPTADIPVVRLDPATGKRTLTHIRWALPLFDPKTRKLAFRLNNARSETIAEKKTFAKHFREDRCLIPADGFYEWKDLGGGKKQPYYITLNEGGPFAFAGIWDRTVVEGKPVESCAIITCGPNSLMEKIHDRMPVILEAKDHATWLNPQQKDEALLQKLLKPYPADLMKAWPVAKLTGDSPTCVEPLKP